MLLFIVNVGKTITHRFFYMERLKPCLVGVGGRKKPGFGTIFSWRKQVLVQHGGESLVPQMDELGAKTVSVRGLGKYLSISDVMGV
jgi:hypothetical protein